MNAPQRTFGLAIVGGGPAGLSPLVAAHRTGRLDALLNDGVAVIERSATLGSGTIGDYAINSDSSGRTFVDCITAAADTDLTALATHPLTHRLARAGDGPVALTDAGAFLGLVGEALGGMIRRNRASAAFTNHDAVAAKRVPGGWQVRIRDHATGTERSIEARHVLLATGATQPQERLAAETIAGCNLLATCGDRLMQSGEVLTQAGLDRVAALLASKPAPRVAIIGGSTSAAAVAQALLHRLPDSHFGPGGLTLLHRRPLRVFYLDRAAARAEGYDEWTEDDVCPISGRVFRFAGFRLDSRELVMQARGLGGRPPEPRLRLLQLGTGDAAAHRVLAEADLVIAALGYRPRALPVEDIAGARMELLAETGPQMAMVDGQCRVLDAGGLPIPGLFGIGLAAGFMPRGALGGEPSFRGQANGLWLWQNDVGALIVDALTPAWNPANRNEPPRNAPFAAEAD